MKNNSAKRMLRYFVLVNDFSKKILTRSVSEESRQSWNPIFDVPR